MSRVAVAMTGPTGAVYWLRALELLLNTDGEVHAVLAESARRDISQEMGLEVPPDPSGQKEVLLRYWVDRAPRRAVPERVKRRFFCHAPGGLEEPIIAGAPTGPLGGAAGAPDLTGMVIIPCAMTTVAAVAAGLAGDLIERTAVGVIREGHPLVIVPREAPLGRIDLRNLLTLSEAGARVHPACPAFGARPKDLTELIDSVVVAALRPLLGDAAAEAAAAARA